MNSVNTLILAGLFVLGLLFVLPVAIAWVALLRQRMWAPKLIRLEALSELIGPAAAARAEMEALGFVPLAVFTMEAGSGIRFPQLLYRHADGRSYAWQMLSAVGQAPYGATFFSIAVDGKILQTGCRTAWLGLEVNPAVQAADSRATTPQAHWQAHLDRLVERPLQTLDAAEAEHRIVTLVEASMPAWEAAGILRPHGPYHVWQVWPALRAALAWWRDRKHINAPWRSAACAGEHLAESFAERHAWIEYCRLNPAERPLVKAALFAISGLAFLVVWAAFFDWTMALLVMAILIVHEGGHALAMRAFGYKDMNLFFLPMVGAVVTARDQTLSVWKRVVILLAGPLPGLLVGVVAWYVLHFLPNPQPPAPWVDTALLMTMGVNLFNLLPITPLDGGQLLEVTLFSQRPRLRLVFAGLSVAGFAALALWLDSPALWLGIVVMLLACRSHWRALRMHRALAGLGHAPDTAELFALAASTTRSEHFNVLHPLVRLIERQSRQFAARWWESVPVVVFLLALWLAVGMAWWWVQNGNSPLPETRTPAQIAFDQRYVELEDTDAEEADLAPLQDKAAALASNDPRRVDLAWMKATQSRGAERLDAELAIISQGHSGLNQDLATQASQYLQDVHVINYAAAPGEYLQTLQTALKKVEPVLGAMTPELQMTRLRLVEARDRGGDTAAAERELGELTRAATQSAECDYQQMELNVANAWFLITHQRNGEAAQRVQGSPCRTQDPDWWHYKAQEALAWALLLDGRYDEGLTQMKEAAWSPAFTPSLVQRLSGASRREPMLLKPLALAYALRQTGDEAGARELLVSKRAKRECMEYRTSTKPSPWIEPWQARREALMHETARDLCPEKEERSLCAKPDSAQSPPDSEGH